MFTLQALAALRMAVKMESRKHLEDWVLRHPEQEDILKQFDAGTPMEIRVVKYAEENDSYVELWRRLDNDKFIARHAYGIGCWSYVCDPLGYCELDRSCPDDFIFVVCDSNGNELFASSNIDPYIPTLKETARNEWNRVKGEFRCFEENTSANFWVKCYNGDSALALDNWLCTFMDPELYPKEIKDMYGYEDNWTSPLHYTTIKKEILSKFMYLGDEYAICKLTNRHDVCGVEWNTYVSAYLENGEYVGYITFYATYFDANNVGRMYSQRDARKIVIDALKEIYPNKGGIHIVKEYDWAPGQYYQRCTDFYGAADSLIGKDKSREHIASVIENEKANPSFVNSDWKELQTMYPGIHLDYEHLWRI